MTRTVGVLLVVMVCALSLAAWAAPQEAQDPAPASTQDPTSAESAWVGVWRLELENPDGVTVIHLVVRPASSGSPVLYDDRWVPEAIKDWKVDGEEASFRFTTGGSFINFGLNKNGATLKGIAKRVHPQFRQEIPLSGRRIVDQADWKPLESPAKLVDGYGLADFSDFLIRNAPAEKEAFVEFWKTKVVPEYYILLGDYYNQPSRVWDALRSEGFPERARLTSESFHKVAEDIKSTLPDLGIDGSKWVILPFSLEPAHLSIGTQNFRFLDSTKTDTEPGRAQLQMARILIESTSGSHPVRNEIADLFRSLIPEYFLYMLKYQDRAKSLGVDEDRLAALDPQLPEIKRKATKRETRPSQDEMKLLMWEFVKFVAGKKSPAELPPLQTKVITEEFREFIREGLPDEEKNPSS